MKDSRGHEYQELLAIQQAHLDRWRLRVIMGVFKPVSEYVIRHNKEADDPAVQHRVFRGQDIVHILMFWPNLGSAYPPTEERHNLGSAYPPAEERHDLGSAYPPADERHDFGFSSTPVNPKEDVI